MDTLGSSRVVPAGRLWTILPVSDSDGSVTVALPDSDLNTPAASNTASSSSTACTVSDSVTASCDGSGIRDDSIQVNGAQRFSAASGELCLPSPRNDSDCSGWTGSGVAVDLEANHDGLEDEGKVCKGAGAGFEVEARKWEGTGAEEGAGRGAGEGGLADDGGLPSLHIGKEVPAAVGLRVEVDPTSGARPEGTGVIEEVRMIFEQQHSSHTQKTSAAYPR